jgi:transcription termination/antitermination protein NusG
MRFYALQIWTGDEERFLVIAGKRLPAGECQLLWPRRSLKIRRGGKWLDSLAPIFPSYLFLQAPNVPPDLYGLIRHTPGFIRFLPANDNVRPLEYQDQKLLSHFLSFGEIVTRSTAYFDVNKRIRITAGPLKDLEGRIVKVDRRKGRARVRLEMYADSFEVDFGFEALDAPVATEK